MALGVNPGGFYGSEDEETVARFLDQTGVTFPVVWDSPRSYTRFAWPQAISPFPRQALVGRDGRIKYLASEHNNEALRAAVTEALAEE